jgi:hypothetical protein
MQIVQGQPYPPNWIYYSEVGNGEWTGTFTFSITSWGTFWKDHIGLWNRVFSIINHINHIIGGSKISSALKVYPSVGPAGIVTNAVKIKKLGFTLYKLEERYVLDPGGIDVYVHSNERFGPIPFLFQRIKKHPARILPEGKGAKYLDMPILGTIWEGDYAVSEKKNAIDAKLICKWAQANENIIKKS